LPIREYFCLDLIKYLGFNLIFLNFIHPNLPGLFDQNTLSAVNEALWTLKIELMFYIIVPVIVMLFKKLNRLIVLVAVYILSFVYSFCMLKFAETNGGDIFIELQRQLPEQLMYFMVGAAGYYYYEYFSAYSKLLLGLAFVCLIIKPLLPWIAIEPLVFGILALFLALAFPYLGNFAKYGDFSYGIYIIHFPVLQIFVSYHLFDTWPVLALISAALVVLLLATLLWNFVEKPFLQKSSHYLAA
jgi:peptidoglycan/LPS O-acetylase OafA/YrhL